MFKPEDFLGKRLLFFVAHPDDEGYECAGTIYKNYLAGLRLRGSDSRRGKSFLVCATFGEKGMSHLKRSVTRKQLRNIRQKELQRAAKFIKVDKLFTFGLPDGGLKKHPKELYKRGLEVAKKVKPDFIFSFGPEGISGHLDHIAIGAAAKKIAKQLKIPFLTFALSFKLKKNFYKWVSSRRRAGNYHTVWMFPRANIRIPVDPKRKLKALRFHKSQLEKNNPYHGFPKNAAEEQLKAEFFCCGSLSISVVKKI